ncbi:MAG: hypothetical protein ACYDAC_01260 [Candidatus Dormibacteria bacterium]
MRTSRFAALGAATIVIAGCGTASSTGQPTASAPPGGLAVRGAAGEVAQVNGPTLVVSAASGDVTVVVSGSATVLQTRTGGVADLSVGTCAQVTGSRDSAGAVTAAAIRDFTATTSGCNLGSGFGSPRGGSRLRPSGAPSAPARTANPNSASLGGSVVAASATSLTLQPSSGGTETVAVPTTVRVTIVTIASLSSITVGTCVQAVGPRDASGAVMARAVTIVPPGPTGCSTTAGGLGGGFFGGRPGGGGG